MIQSRLKCLDGWQKVSLSFRECGYFFIVIMLPKADCVISSGLFSAVFWLENKRKTHPVLRILRVFVEEEAAVTRLTSGSCVQLITAWILHLQKSYLKEPNKIKCKSNKTSGGPEHLKWGRRCEIGSSFVKAKWHKAWENGWVSWQSPVPWGGWWQVGDQCPQQQLVPIWGCEYRSSAQSPCAHPALPHTHSVLCP